MEDYNFTSTIRSNPLLHYFIDFIFRWIANLSIGSDYKESILSFHETRIDLSPAENGAYPPTQNGLIHP